MSFERRFRALGWHSARRLADLSNTFLFERLALIPLIRTPHRRELVARVVESVVFF